MSARTLMWLAVALRGVDVALGPWGSEPQLPSAMWWLVLAVTAIALRSSPRAGRFMALGVALMTAGSVLGTLHPRDPDLVQVVPFSQLRRLLWVVEASLIIAAAATATRTPIDARPRSNIVPTLIALRRPLLVGAGCWAAALALIFWWPGTVSAGSLPVVLIPIALFARFGLVRRLGRVDAIVARVAGWLGVVCCVLTLTPVAYGLVIIYLLMTIRGMAIVALALIGTFALLTGAGQLRRSLRSASAAPDVVLASSPSS